MPRPGRGGRGLTDPSRRVYWRGAAGYEARWDRYLRETISATLSALAPMPGEAILDVGCGTGLLLRKIQAQWPETKLWGVDLAPEMIEIARSESRGAATFAVADAASLDFRDGVFDAVVSSSSLHEWSDPRAVTSELARVTRPGGRLVITDWCRDVPIFWPLALRLSLFDRSVEHIYSRAELEALLREASYAVEAATVYRVATFWGMMTVVARLRRGCQVSRLVGSRMCTSTRSSRDRRG